MVVVHEPPVVTHGAGGLGVEVAPRLSTLVNVTGVPSGARTKPCPSPRSTMTVAVKVCGSPTRLVPLGVIEILASWKTLTASPELGAWPSVDTVNGADPPTLRVELAWPVTVPAHSDVNVVENWPAAS